MCGKRTLKKKKPFTAAENVLSTFFSLDCQTESNVCARDSDNWFGLHAGHTIWIHSYNSATATASAWNAFKAHLRQHLILNCMCLHKLKLDTDLIMLRMRTRKNRRVVTLIIFLLFGCRCCCSLFVSSDFESVQCSIALSSSLSNSVSVSIYCMTKTEKCAHYAYVFQCDRVCLFSWCSFPCIQQHSWCTTIQVAVRSCFIIAHDSLLNSVIVIV